MHIALFGGTFNPPHIAHQTIANYIIDHKHADQVWFVPVYQHPWAKELNKEDLADYKHRHTMLTLISDAPDIKVKEFKEVSFTYNTLKYFQNLHPDHKFSWIMGSEYIHVWSKFLETHPKLSKFNIFVYPREGHQLVELYPNMTLLKNAPLVTISSTQIRKNLEEHTSHLDTKVLNYIKKNSTYITTPGVEHSHPGGGKG